MLFLASELVNKAEITILSARDMTRTWVPGRVVGVYKTRYNTWLSSRLQNQAHPFLFFSFSFFFSRYHAPSLVGSTVL